MEIDKLTDMFFSPVKSENENTYFQERIKKGEKRYFFLEERNNPVFYIAFWLNINRLEIFYSDCWYFKTTSF